MPKTFEARRKHFEKLLLESHLSSDEKELALSAMDFGYSAGFCFRDQEIKGNGFRQQIYSDAYENFRAFLLIQE